MQRSLTARDSYEYRVSLAGLASWSAPTALVGDVVSGLDAETEYDFQVRGVSADGEAIDAEWSNTATAETDAAPAPGGFVPVYHILGF